MGYFYEDLYDFHWEGYYKLTQQIGFFLEDSYTILMEHAIARKF